MTRVRSDGGAVLTATALLAAAACTIANPGFDQEDVDTEPSVSASSTSAASTATTTASGSVSATGTTTGEPGPDSESTTAYTSTTGSTAETTDCMEVELYPDLDGDSFGDDDARPTLGCPQRGFSVLAGDCDDGIHEINPNADELCNGGIDDDCDGLFDELSQQNTACDGCDLAEFEGHAYWFCEGPTNWDMARGFCTDHGVDLTIVDAPDENAFIFAKLAPPSFWLGARDVSPNPTDYSWVDGSPLSFKPWYGPNPDLDDACVMMLPTDDSLWRDRSCGDPGGFVCESSL